MNLYDCVSTGDEVGMIQIVPDSTTLASILMIEKSGKKKKTRRKSSLGGEEEEKEEEEEDASKQKKFFRSAMLRKASTAFKALTGTNVLYNWLWNQTEKVVY